MQNLEKQTPRSLRLENKIAHSDPVRAAAWAALKELSEYRENPTPITADIDIVWVLSAPGTYKEGSTDGVYAGSSSDRTAIDHGIEIVKQITGMRLNKNPEEVTREDIEKHGPILYYNGESSRTKTAKAPYPQNAHLLEAAESKDFPIPPSKLVVDEIEENMTPSQVIAINKWLKENNYKGKVATVSIGAHSPRVSRYIKRHENEIPEGVTFIPAPALQPLNPVGTTTREIHKIERYGEKGDLSLDPYF